LPLSGLAGANPASCREKNTPTPGFVSNVIKNVMGNSFSAEIPYAEGKYEHIQGME